MAADSPTGAPVAYGSFERAQASSWTGHRPARGAHRCAAGRACRDPELDGDTRAPAVIADPDGLCDRCARAVAVAVAELERDYADLMGALGGDETGPPGEVVAASRGRPVPINTSVDALARSLGEWADAALGVVSAALAMDHPEPYRGRGYPRRYDRVITAARRVVEPNVELLLSIPPEPVLVWARDGIGREVIDADGIDIALRLAANHRQVASILGQTNPRERLAMPCPVLDCGAQTLGRSNGSTDVTCTTCGGRWSEREYAWLAGLLVADYDKQEQETDMLEWLLAEKTWQAQQLALEVAAQDYTLTRLRRLTDFSPAEVSHCTAYEIVQVVAEVLG